MALTETRRPYEFLARWNPQTGAFSGAHIQWIDVIERDGAQVSATPTKAFGVGEGAAFPLADILTQVQSDALAALDAAQAQVATLTADKTAADQALAAAQEQVAALTAQLAQYQTPVDENGVPTRVTMRQARLALLGAGLLSSVSEAINNMAEPAKSAAQIEWEYSGEVHRNRPFVQQLGAALGLSSQQLDALFVQAATL